MKTVINSDLFEKVINKIFDLEDKLNNLNNDLRKANKAIIYYKDCLDKINKDINLTTDTK